MHPYKDNELSFGFTNIQSKKIKHVKVVEAKLT